MQCQNCNKGTKILCEHDRDSNIGQIILCKDCTKMHYWIRTRCIAYNRGVKIVFAHPDCPWEDSLGVWAFVPLDDRLDDDPCNSYFNTD